MPDVSVIIPVYNDSLRLARCLAALEKQSLGAERYEVIVIDNASSEDLSALREGFPAVRFDVEKKRGSFAARNKGLASAKGNVIAFTDSDCVPDRHWIENGLRALGESTRPAMLGGKVEIFADQPSNPNFWERFDLTVAFPQEGYLLEAKFAVTANMFAHRQLFDEVGQFDGVMLSGGDQEWGQRVHEAGHPQLFDGSVLVQHPARASFREHLKKQKRVASGIYQMRQMARLGWLQFSRRALWELRPPYQSWKRIWTSEFPATIPDRLCFTFVTYLIRMLRTFEQIKMRSAQPIPMSLERNELR